MSPSVPPPPCRIAARQYAASKCCLKQNSVKCSKHDDQARLPRTVTCGDSNELQTAPHQALSVLIAYLTASAITAYGLLPACTKTARWDAFVVTAGSPGNAKSSGQTQEKKISRLWLPRLTKSQQESKVRAINHPQSNCNTRLSSLQ